MSNQNEKMIMAIMAGDLYADVTRDLNENGYYTTFLGSTGGFLQKKTVTLMIGLGSGDLETALAILKKHAVPHAGSNLLTTTEVIGFPTTPVKVESGGIVVFVMNIESCTKF